MIPAFHDYCLEPKITKCGDLLYLSLVMHSRFSYPLHITPESLSSSGCVLKGICRPAYHSERIFQSPSFIQTGLGQDCLDLNSTTVITLLQVKLNVFLAPMLKTYLVWMIQSTETLISKQNWVLTNRITYSKLFPSQGKGLSFRGKDRACSDANCDLCGKKLC